jgi:hypothetical protein
MYLLKINFSHYFSYAQMANTTWDLKTLKSLFYLCMPLYRTGSGIRHRRPDNHPARHTGTSTKERSSIPGFGKRDFLYLTFLQGFGSGSVFGSALI